MLQILKHHYKKILIAAAVAAIINILLVFLVQVVIKGDNTVLGILQKIASGVYGAKAFSGGYAMAAIGFLLHFFITLIFTTLYMLIHKQAAGLIEERTIRSLIYGCFVWAVMNLKILPMTDTNPPAGDFLQFSLSLGLVLVGIAIPMVFVISKMYAREADS